MDSGNKKIKRWPVYILLFPVFFVLHGYADNFRFISALSALVLCLSYIGGALIITAAFYLLYKDLSKAALLTFFILAFNFFFGAMLDFLKEVFQSGFITRYSFLVPAFLVVTAVLFFIIKKRKTLFKINYYLNTLLILLMAIDTVMLVIQIVDKNKNSYKSTGAEFAVCDSCSKPDVYIIVLDEYAGLSELKDIFRYDNSPFIDSLAARSFKTISNSHSNYSYTPYSTASFLNMEYLDEEKTKSVKKGGYKHAINRIENNITVNLFLSNGYRFFNSSPFTIAGQSSMIGGSFVPTNAQLITVGTFLSRFEKDVMLSAANKLDLVWYLKKSMYITLNGNKELYELTKKIAATEPGPKIIYTHLLMPHYPYYYNEAGQLRSFDDLRKSSLDNNDDYLAYLKYTNHQMILLIDHILSHSSIPPVIALLSDHGYRQYKNQTDMNYYFSNLLSIHLPHRNYSSYHDSTNNVNFLRIMLNTEFGQKLPLLEDKIFSVDF